MTQTITDKEKQPVILDMARVNSRLIVLKKQHKDILEDAEILKKKLLPYYRDRRRFEERMEAKYDLTKSFEKLKEKTEELQELELNMHIAGTQIIISYLNQYWDTFFQEKNIETGLPSQAMEFANQKLKDKLNRLLGGGDYVTYDFSCPWKSFYDLAQNEDNLKLWYQKKTNSNSRDRSKIIVNYIDTDMGIDFSLSIKMIDEFNIIVMSVVDELLSHKREQEESQKQKEFNAKEARRNLYYRLKQEFEGEDENG